MCCSRGVRLALQECDLEAYIQVSDLERYQSDPQKKQSNTSRLTITARPFV